MKESDQVPFGLGILSQGEVVTSPEQYRLLAKKYWLGLWEFLRENDELIKAGRIPVPWCLEDDLQINEAISLSRMDLSRFSTEDSYREFVNSDEGHYDVEAISKLIDNLFSGGTVLSDRPAWIKSQVEVYNPETVLDVGFGYGQLATVLASEGYQVTAMSPNQVGVEACGEYAKKNNLPAQFINAIIETVDFGQVKFDVVVCAEIIEHVANDVAIISKCVDLANKAVVITTPMGSCESGFASHSEGRSRAHVRVYTERTFKALLAQVPGVTIEKIEVVKSTRGFRGQHIECFCAVLKKEESNVNQVEQAESGAPQESKPEHVGT
jgi:2-polyprenyl-3-methyl-5-hydroxy-6-metoxy-1,4-benzoquinol methylase